MSTQTPPMLGDFYRGTETLASDPAEFLFRRVAQAEALAYLLHGEPGEAFRAKHDAIQDDVCWLLSDLLGDCRLALDAVTVQKKAPATVAAVQRHRS